MKVLPLLLFLVYINDVISDSPLVEDKTSRYLKKKALPKKNAQLLLSRRVFNKATSLKPKKPSDKKGYTVFPPVGSVEKKLYHGPESPYFSIEQETVHKTRVKKVLPEFATSAVRKKRSAPGVIPKNHTKVASQDTKQKKLNKLKNAKKEKIARLRRKQSKRSGVRNKTRTKLQGRSGDAVNAAKTKGKRLKKQGLRREKLRKKRAKRSRKTKTNITSLVGRSKKKKSLDTNLKPTIKAEETRRLIAAKDATIEEYPYVVSIQKDKEHWCAGAILNPRLVITTANCVWKSNRVSRLRVRAGSRHADSGGQVTKIQEVMKHPNWSIRKNPDNDVALLLLDRNLRFSDSVHGVDLPNRVMLPVFDDAWITSWGAERRDGIYDKKAMTLQAFHARLIDRRKCNNVTQRFGVIVSENFICLSQTGRKAPCTRDTGAPAVSDGVVWGLASWGIRRLCGTERFPAMFSYTASQTNMDFISNATHFLMADERYYPFPDRFPNVRAKETTGGMIAVQP